jgi:hypothetical protein
MDPKFLLVCNKSFKVGIPSSLLHFLSGHFHVQTSSWSALECNEPTLFGANNLSGWYNFLLENASRTDSKTLARLGQENRREAKLCTAGIVRRVRLSIKGLFPLSSIVLQFPSDCLDYENQNWSLKGKQQREKNGFRLVPHELAKYPACFLEIRRRSDLILEAIENNNFFKSNVKQARRRTNNSNKIF